MNKEFKIGGTKMEFITPDGKFKSLPAKAVSLSFDKEMGTDLSK